MLKIGSPLKRLFFTFRYQSNTAKDVLDTIMSIQPKDAGGGSGETRESVVTRLADDMLEKLPNDYVPHEVRKMNPLDLEIWEPLTVKMKLFWSCFLCAGESATSEDGSFGVHEHLSKTRDWPHAASHHLGTAYPHWSEAGHRRNHHYEWGM